MSTSVMAVCWPIQMPPTPKSVLIALADNANDQGYCWPSISTICEKTCFSKRAVIDAILWLESSSVLKADRTNGRHTTYVIYPEQFVKPVQQAHQCSSSTGALDALVPVQQAHQPVHLPHKPVREMHPNHKEPSLTKSKALIASAPLDLSSWPEAPSEDALDGWMKMRKKKRAEITQLVITTMGKQLAIAEKIGWSVDECLAQCVFRNWQGLDASWLTPKQPVSGPSFPVGPTSKTGAAMQKLQERINANQLDRNRDSEGLAGPVVLELGPPTRS